MFNNDRSANRHTKFCDKKKQSSIQEWSKYFTIEEVKKFELMKNKEGKHIKHPIVHLINNENVDVSFNTKLSFDIINNCDDGYLARMKAKIMEEQNFSNINGFLGEIRCYGYLLDSFNDNNITVKPIPTTKNNQTSDFEVINEENNEKVYIEVNTKQSNDKESKDLYKFHKNFDKSLKNERQNKMDNKPKVCMSITSFAPFGRSKDKSRIDAIQKIAQTKQNKNQIPKGSIGILWMDFQSEGISKMIDLDESKPLHYIRNFGMFSGVLWHALYGKKDLPIFNSSQFHWAYKGLENFDRMQHEGLFIQRHDIAGVVFSEGRYTLMLENPFAEKQIPMWFLENIINTPKFNYEHSKIQFPRYNMQQEIENEYKRIIDLSKIPNRSFHK